MPMVTSRAETVDTWMEALVPDREPAIAQLRELCRTRLAGWVERMQWGMPGYGPAGQDAVVSFNSQARHIALYAGPTTVERFADRLAGLDCGKGCIRYTRPEAMDFSLIFDMLDDIRARGGPMC
jgi:uncharacterized protein YdhG (YjbR/CyaY superfamily)